VEIFFDWEDLMPSKLSIAAAAFGCFVAGAFCAKLVLAQTSAPRAYLVAEVQVTDPDTYKSYIPKVQPALDPFGGHFIARAGKVVSLEGEPPKGRVVLIEFPTLENAQRFWESPAYREIAPIRQKSANSRIFLLEGEAARP
jgi:uncharacterized protein (DUF1330 family)